jgi:hypothetical protein
LFDFDTTKEPFSNSQVHCAEYISGLRQKATSTTATLEFLPVNLQKRKFYWTLPPSLGMRGVDIVGIIDIDEVFFFSSIWIKGLVRQFCVNGAVKMESMGKGRR